MIEALTVALLLILIVTTAHTIQRMNVLRARRAARAGHIRVRPRP
ncbi:hypothetical protein AB0M94_19240 [Streptomyces xanthochromogenes]